jgi:hypothetical protein
MTAELNVCEPASAHRNLLLRMPHWAWMTIGIGVVLRLRQYAINRSLWYDEAALALSLLRRPPSRLWQPLEYHQGAPVAFLMIEKLAGKLAGYSELVLRFFPLVAGILALFVFYHLLRFVVTPRSIPLALILFSLSTPLIYYSSEVKQYSIDVALTLILLWAAAKMSRSRISGRALLGFSALGAAAIWFSHPVSFVLAGDGSVLILLRAAQRDWQGVKRMAWVLVAWSTSFVVFYFTSLHALSQDRTLLDFWARAFPPRPIWSISAGSWLVDTFFSDFRDLTLVIPVLGEALLVVGCAALIRRDKLAFCLLAAPFLPLFWAAWLHKYPLHGRLLLFVAPILLLLVTEGTMRAYEGIRVVSPAFAIMLLALVIAKPAWMAAKMLVHPDRGEDFKVALRYVRSHQRLGDVCYVYYGAKYQFAYYSDLYKLPENNVLVGADCGRTSNCYAADLERIRGRRRVWILLSHVLVGNDWNEELILRSQLDAVGVRLDLYQTSGARAYLYDLGQLLDPNSIGKRACGERATPCETSSSQKRGSQSLETRVSQAN